ncbi:MAG: DUF72 domain-containing protein [Chloroflexi bacterium]|nr:MAG: DUF72 domain-containing protein [Chloroflexota bacterium]
MKVYIGTSGWVYGHWRGLFYPEKLAQSRWLEYYSQHFATVELNNSFYHLPSDRAFKGWRERTAPGFVYAVKVSRYITHVKRLKDAEEPIENFLMRAQILNEKLGPLLYQLPPNMRRNDAVLERFLDVLPMGLKHVFEFRHESWFDEGVFDLLRMHNAGFCIYDMPGLVTPVVATADFAYVRFHGSEALYESCYSDAQLKRWAKVIARLGQKLDAVYVYFNNDSCAYAVRNARTLAGELGALVEKG